MMKLFFDSILIWMKVLLGIREVLVGLIGLKMVKGIDMVKELIDFEGKEG